MRLPGRMIWQVLSSIWHKPATVMYPAVKVEMPPRFRGKLKFEPSKCICCKLCMKDCPTDAINIVKLPDGKVECQIDLSRCIYCAQCVDSCPKNALEATREFELASLNRDTLKVVFDGEAFKAPPKDKPASQPEPPKGPEDKA